MLTQYLLVELHHFHTAYYEPFLLEAFENVAYEATGHCRRFENY